MAYSYSNKCWILLIILLFQQCNNTHAGALCYPACCVVCCEMGPFKFAAAFGVILDIAGCGAMCGVACAFGLFVPPACFANDTMISVRDGDVIVEKPISLVKENDQVLTLKNNKPSWTRVIRNLHSKGSFKFVQVTTQSSPDGPVKPVTITSEHGVVLLSNSGNDKLINSAHNIVPGDMVLSSTGNTSLVVGTVHVTLKEKYTLETADGTILASDIFMTTICAEEISGKKLPFESAMQNWRSRHPYVVTPHGFNKSWHNEVTFKLGLSFQDICKNKSLTSFTPPDFSLPPYSFPQMRSIDSGL